MIIPAYSPETNMSKLNIPSNENDGQFIKYLVCAPTMRVPTNVSKTVNAYLAFRAVLRAGELCIKCMRSLICVCKVYYSRGVGNWYVHERQKGIKSLTLIPPILTQIMYHVHYMWSGYDYSVRILHLIKICSACMVVQYVVYEIMEDLEMEN